MKTIVLKKIILASVLMPLALASSLAFAAPFAEFSYRGDGDDFNFRSSGNTATFFATSPDIEVRFKTFASGLPPSFYFYQHVTLVTTSVISKKAIPISPGSNISQALDSFSMSFTTMTGKNLLSMVATTLDSDAPVALVGSPGTDLLDLKAGQSLQNVVYTSDYLTFSPSAKNSASLTFHLAPTDFGPTIGASGFLADFEASGIGIFSSTAKPTIVPSTTPPVPEPETYALLLGGLGLMAFMTRRLQRAPI